MLQQERFEDPQEAIRAALQGFQATLWTALIGIVETVDLVANTCTVQPAVRGVRRKADGTIVQVQLPILLDVPIQWPAGGGYTFTFPLAAGDEGLVVFTSRCFDPWWQSGGDDNNQVDVRMHDLSDGVFLAGVKSQPNKLASVSSTAAQLRKNDGSSYVELAAHQITLYSDANNYVQTQDATGGGVTTIKGSTKVVINGVTIDPSGNVVSSGEITAKTSHTVSAHKHGGVTTGGGQTATPTG